MSLTAQRNTLVADANINTGRYMVASTPTLTETAVQVSHLHTVVDRDLTYRYGVIARWTDINNWVFWGFYSDGPNKWFGLALVKRLAGTVTTVVTYGGSSTGSMADPNQAGGDPPWAHVWWGLRLTITSGGFYAGQVNVAGSDWFTLVAGYDANFASGTLASGKVGFYDAIGQNTFDNRYYTAFQAWVPPKDAVVFASQSVEVGTNQLIREDSTGTAWTPVTYSVGDLPRIPPTTVDNRSSEFFIKLSRGDLESLPDPSIDNLSARVFYRPCYLFLGEP